MSVVLSNKFWLLSILLMVLFSFSALATEMGYYKFNDNLNDSLALQPTLTGNYTGFVAGRVNNAIDLEKNSSQGVKTTSLTSAGSIRTIDFWFRPESIDNYAPLVFLYQHGNNNILLMQALINKICFQATTDSSTRWDMYSTTVLSAGSWYHVIVTFGSGGAKLYINGNINPEATSSSTAVPTNSFVNFDIGNSSLGAGPYDGLIDNLRMVDYEYTTENVTASWNNGNGRDFTADIIFPTYSNFQNNASPVTKKNDVVNWGVLLSDDTELSWYVFGHNDSGVWQNTSNGSLNGTSAFVDELVTITSTRGKYVCGQFFFKDTSNNWNNTLLTDSGACFTVANTPPAINNLYPDNGDHDFLNLTVNFTYSDADGDSGNCSFYVNGTLEDTQESISSGNVVTFTANFTADEGHYKWNVTCTDSYIPASKERLFVLDRINPIIEWTNPSEDNTTISKQDLTLDVTCSDENLWMLWVNLSNSAGTIIYSNSYDNLTTTEVMANDFISLTEEGNYTVAITCSDSHTTEVIPNYDVEKDIVNGKLSYDTGDNEISVSLKNSGVNLDDFSTAKSTDRYTFTYDFSSTKADETARTYTFVLEAAQPLIYLKNSQYKAHFISGKNWIDFNLGDGKADYNVKKITNNQYEISISTTKTLLAFNSIGGLNIVEKHAKYTYDITSPVWSNNLTNNSNPYINEWIKYSVFWEDEHALDYAWLEHNVSGGSLITDELTDLDVSEHNFTVEKQVTAEPGETFCLRTYTNDTAGNENVSSLDCYTVQNAPPAVNSVSATSPNGFGENVVITANITDPDGQQYISLVKAGITPPGESETNYTMWSISSDTWTLNTFTDYTNGTYDYTVYAIDSGGLMDSSSGTFEMYDNLTISIFPLKMSYSGNELVQITDPPGEWFTSETGFNDGNYSQTYYNTTVNGVMLNFGQSSGTYTSKVFDAGSTAGWDSIEWSSGVYQQELSALEGKVLLLHLNEASSAIEDASGKSNNGVYNGALYSQSGKFNTALGFDGVDDSVVINASSSLDTGSLMSIEFWAYADTCPTQASPENYDSFLFIETNSGGYHRGIWGNGSCQILLQPGAGTGAAQQTNVNYPLNQWTHFAVNFYQSGSNVVHELYLNGELKDNHTYASTTMWSNADYYEIGSDSLGRYFDGLIDELAIYNRSLSSTEILEHYKQGALRLNLSVRSCDDSVCSGESFVEVNDTSPQNLNLVNNTYFQYKFDFSTSNVTYSPELYNVTVDYTLEIPPENQSKLRNDAGFDTSIYLLMKVQFWNGSWTDEAVRYFEFLQVQPGEANQIKLDQYWQNWSTFDKINYGVHRVYAAAVDDENNIITNIDGSLVEAYHNFTVVNTAPTAPVLLYPLAGSAFGVLPEFNWSNSYDVDADALSYTIEIDNNSSFASLEYNSSIAEDASGITGVLPTLPIRYNYYWRVKANDGYADSDWSSVRNFTYAMWNVTFNVQSGETGLPINNLNNISCNYNEFVFDGDTSNPYGPYAFPPGSWECAFEESGYYDKTKIFVSDVDKIVDVSISVRQDMTVEEHTWLEALYNCIILKDCDLYDLLLEINQTVVNTWQHVKPTDESVITSETAVSNTLSPTSNITYDYTVNIPIKAGYFPGTYLPVRIGFWFMDETNTTCYNQGTLPTGVTLIKPYCQPLMVETIGPMGGSVSFTVDLRPNLTAGTYNVKRIIEIDPNNEWIGYGQEVVGLIVVTEDVTGEGDVNLEKTGEEMPDSDSGESSSSSSSGGSGGGGGGKGTTIINNNYYPVSESPSTEKEDEKETDGKDENKEEKFIENTHLQTPSLSGITGAVVSGIESNMTLVGILALVCLILSGLVGYFFAKSRKK